jgi:hypothetical protein
MIELFENKEYKELVKKISENYIKAKQRAFKAINNELTFSNWETGKYIVEFEQKGNIKAEYGKKLLDRLSKDLTVNNNGVFITGYSQNSNVYQCFTVNFSLTGVLNWHKQYKASGNWNIANSICSDNFGNIYMFHGEN